MICYKCKHEIGKAVTCPVCGADTSMLQKIRLISNRLYNEGYEKACIRDLAGATECLTASLKYNKYNTDARNLLGLIYYEIGEGVNALAEWVISTSLQPEDNLASRYLKAMRDDSSLINQLSQTARKYNQAVSYCQLESWDLAKIQLRKVISVNPKMVKAHQLLALLYMNEGQLDKAKKELRTAGRIDVTNSLTLRYMKEVNDRLRAHKKTRKTSEEEEELLIYQSGNDTVIMPKRFRESNTGTMIFYMVMGLILGALLGTLLIAPHAIRTVRTDYQRQLLESTDNNTTNQEIITSLEDKVSSMEEQVKEAKEQSENVETEIENYQSLLNAYICYADGDEVEAGKAMAEIDTEYLEPDALEVYNSLEEDVMIPYMETIYDKAYRYYECDMFPQAINTFQQVVDYDEDFKEGYAAYYLAMSYQKNKDTTNAAVYFRYVVENYPDTDRGNTSQNYLNQMSR